MMLTSWTSYIATALTVVCVLLAIVSSLHDVIARTIPNGLLLILTVASLAAAGAGGHFVGSVLAAAGVFAVAAWCWQRGWMGGGDVKLLGAVALGIPASAMLTFVIAVTIAGGLLAFFYLAARRLIPAPCSIRPANLFARTVRAERWRISRGAPLPYACAITAGLLFVVV